MEDHAPTNDTPTNGSAAKQPPAAIALTGADAGGSLTNTDIAALSRERQQTLLSILPPAVAAILIANRRRCRHTSSTNYAEQRRRESRSRLRAVMQAGPRLGALDD